MSQPPPWRVGNHYGIHVYAGDEPVATFHSAVSAERAVAAVNGTAVPEQMLRRGDRVRLIQAQPVVEAVVEVVALPGDAPGLLHVHTLRVDGFDMRLHVPRGTPMEVVAAAPGQPT